MRILHVIGSMDPRAGGPCQGVRNLAPRAIGQGNSVEIVCLNDPHADYLSHENLCIHALGQGRTAWCYHPALRPWLEANLPRFDAVILNGLWQYPGYVVSQLSQRPGMPPYFVFPHGMLDPWFQRAPERRWKAIRNWFYWKLIEKKVIARAEAVFFTCAEELRLARETFTPYEPKRQVNVGYGVSQPPAFHAGMATAFAQKCPGLNGRPYFLFLSRIHPKKGMDLMIKAYAAIYHAKTESKKQKSELNSGLTVAGEPSTSDLQPATLPCLVIAGPGLESEYGQAMQKLAAKVSGQRSAVSGQTGPASSQPSTSNSPPSPLGGEGRGEVSVTSDLRLPTSGSMVSGQTGPASSQPLTLNSPPSPLGGEGRGEVPVTSDLRPPTSGSMVSGQTGSASSQPSTLNSPPSPRWGEGRGEVPPAGFQPSTLNSEPAILWPGMLTGDAKWGALYGAEAFVLTSHQENFGIAVAEALACGTPVLISNQINIWHEIAQDQAGLVADDTLAGAEQLFQQWKNLSPADKVAMKHAAQATYANRFGIVLASKNLLAAMGELTANNHGEKTMETK